MKTYKNVSETSVTFFGVAELWTTNQQTSGSLTSGLSTNLDQKTLSFNFLSTILSTFIVLFPVNIHAFNVNDKSFESDFILNDVDCPLMAVQRVVQKKQSSCETPSLWQNCSGYDCYHSFHIRRIAEKFQIERRLGWSHSRSWNMRKNCAKAQYLLKEMRCYCLCITQWKSKIQIKAQKVIKFYWKLSTISARCLLTHSVIKRQRQLRFCFDVSNWRRKFVGGNLKGNDVNKSSRTTLNYSTKRFERKFAWGKALLENGNAQNLPYFTRIKPSEIFRDRIAKTLFYLYYSD